MGRRLHEDDHQRAQASIGLAATQFVVGNLSLAFWSMLWGVVGMILCIPIMVIVMIICGHFGPTRPIAILLSSDGEIEGYPEANAAP